MNVRIFWVRAMKCMCAQTRPRFILSSERVFGGMEFEPMLTPREKSPLSENFPRGGSNPRRCGQRAQTLPTSYSGPENESSQNTSSVLETSSFLGAKPPITVVAALLLLEQQPCPTQLNMYSRIACAAHCNSPDGHRKADNHQTHGMHVGGDSVHPLTGLF